MKPEFVHLHLHTEYSLLDGACPILDLHKNPSNLFQKASQYNMPALAITDHGNMFGTIEFYKTCKSAGIKPIIGCEFYIAADSRFKKGKKIGEGIYHLGVIAKDEVGYKNLMKLASIAYTEGFYYRPRIDKEVLSNYSKGLIGLSCCPKGEIPDLILKGQLDKALQLIHEYEDIFGKENFYLELQNHGLSQEKTISQNLINFAKKDNLPLVATNDVHYIEKEDAYAQEILLCIGTGKKITDSEHFHFPNNEFYFKSPQEMENIFSEVPSAIKNTLKISEQCNICLDFNTFHLPHFQSPNGEDNANYLRRLCQQGLKERYPNATDIVKQRMEKELNIINEMKFVDYFLIVSDIVNFAKSQGILVGPGRGSGAGSIVAYLLKITEIDPLKYGLIFERFLNPGRKSMPDLDIDFSDVGRDRVIEYVIQKYGQENVAQIITFGSMNARAAIRDVGRAIGILLPEVDKIAKLIPFGNTINESLNSIQELKEKYDTDPLIKNLLDVAQKLEGLKRHTSVHAAGIVITEDGIENYTPFAKTSKEVITTQYEGEYLVELGLLKMDFLGLTTLTVISQSEKLIEENKGEKIDIEKIPLDDIITYNLLKEARTIGVFQLESSGMRKLLKKLLPNEISDLVALLALYRPGPIYSGMLDEFIQRKNGEVKINYLHPLLEPILKETYGVCLYQEQVMEIATKIADFSLSDADILRKAMSKKNPAEIEAQRENFISSATKKGLSFELANKIFSLMAKFGSYGFNKSHSCAYALLSYQTAYLKAHYPIEYMTSLLNSEIENTDKIALYVNECREMGIKIFPPSVQESDLYFKIENGGIRFALLGIKNVGKQAIESIIVARQKKGKFNSLYDFCNRVDLRQVNRRVIESLIKAGAFSSLEVTCAQLFESLDIILEKINKKDSLKNKNQISLFQQEKEFEIESNLGTIKELPQNKLLANEKEVLGFYLTAHPLERYKQQLKSKITCFIADLESKDIGKEVKVGGIITSCKKVKTKRGNLMYIFTLDDQTASVEVIGFPVNSSSRELSYFREDNIVIVKGTVDIRNERIQILSTQITPLTDFYQQDKCENLIIHLNVKDVEDEILEQIKEILSLASAGKTNVFLNLITSKGEVKIKTDFKILVDSEIIKKLEEIVGFDNIEKF